MGKASKSRKARAAAAPPYLAPADAAAAVAPDTAALDPVDLAITLETLAALLATPTLLRTPALAPARALIAKLHALAAPPETDAERLIAALRTRDHPRARALLADVRAPKLGALQRWVRECDAAATPALQEDTWRTLEAIIRAAGAPAAASTLTRFAPWAHAAGARAPVARLVRERRLVCKCPAVRVWGAWG